MVKTILFPSSYFSIRSVDEDLKAEYDAAVDTGLFDTVLFSYDKWFHEDKLVLNQPIDKPCKEIYRGWQTFLSPLKGQCQYQALIGLIQTTRLTGGFDL